MQQRIFSKTGILLLNQSILLDRSGLWQRFGCEQIAIENGYEVVHFSDDMQLRRYYEFDCQDRPNDKRIMVIDRAALLVPYDIQKRFQVIDLSFWLLFPMLDDMVLAHFPGLDFDFLSFAVDRAVFHKLNEQETAHFCTEGLRTAELAAAYGESELNKALFLAESAVSHRDWTPVAIAFGKASMLKHSGVALSGFDSKQDRIEQAFVKWIGEKYNKLSGTVDPNRPVLLNKVNDFIRKGNEKIALIVMDGMSFENFFTIQRMIAHEPFTYDVQASFSFFPTVTSVARQSIFSGKLPREHAKPFSLDNEEKQWFSYWQDHGYRSSEITYLKIKETDEEFDIPPQTKIVGIIVNICDDLMHGELQGLDGLLQGIEAWKKKMGLVHLIESLLKHDFSVYMTADHGNTSAIAEGRFTKPGVLAEPASRRAVIYQSYLDARELDKFKTKEYIGTYLPEGYTAYLFECGTCYGNRGTEYITHGGMTLEETIVPFVRIGEYHG